MHGRTKAVELWHRYQLSTPVDLRRLAAELGLEIVTFPFRGRIKEMIVDGVIGVQPGLRRPWFRWYVAHAIGHHTLHVGTSFYLDWWQWVSHAKAERQAEEFAAWLLAGPDGWQLTDSELGIPREKFALLRMLGRRAGLMGVVGEKTEPPAKGGRRSTAQPAGPPPRLLRT